MTLLRAGRGARRSAARATDASPSPRPWAAAAFAARVRERDAVVWLRLRA